MVNQGYVGFENRRWRRFVGKKYIPGLPAEALKGRVIGETQQDRAQLRGPFARNLPRPAGGVELGIGMGVLPGERCLPQSTGGEGCRDHPASSHAPPATLGTALGHESVELAQFAVTADEVLMAPLDVARRQIGRCNEVDGRQAIIPAGRGVFAPEILLPFPEAIGGGDVVRCEEGEEEA